MSTVVSVYNLLSQVYEVYPNLWTSFMASLIETKAVPLCATMKVVYAAVVLSVNNATVQHRD
jgi:hypothetical protein